jgi:hypothetical protein
LSETRISNRDNAPRNTSNFSWNRQAEYVIYPERRLVVVRFGKKVTAEDIARYAQRLRIHPSFHPEFSEIADLSDAEEIDLQAADFLRLADKTDPFSPDAKRAFVVQTSTQSHAARMHKILRSKKNIEIFDSFDEAEEWVRT